MNIFQLSKSVLLTCFFMVIYYIIMEKYYDLFIIENYARFGFVFKPNSVKYLEAYMIFGFAIVLSVPVSRLSGFIYSVYIFFMIFFLVPNLITYSHSDQMGAPHYSILLLLILLGTVSTIKYKIPEIKSSTYSNGTVMLFVLAALVPILISFGVYFNPLNLLLLDVYNTRDYFDESTSPLINYLFNWLIKAIVPVSMIYFLINKRYGYAFLSFVVLLYLYLVSGNKLVYLTSFVMLFFFVAGNGYLQKTRNIVIALVVGLMAAPVIDAFVFGNDTIKGTFVMRMLFLPSYLNYYFFDFFKDQPLYFAESHFFGMFVDYPFHRSIGYIIAEKYLNVSDMNANNGTIGDGFMNLGYLGVGINIMIVTLVFQFFNSLKTDARYLGIFFVMIFLFLSVPMLTMFVTSGLWLLFLMGMSFMRTKEVKADWKSVEGG